MKSRSSDTVDEFWTWFVTIAHGLATDPNSPSLIREVDSRMHQLNPNLSWEFGPGLSRPWQFVVSPDLDPAMRPEARRIVSRAPDLPDWEFYAARQPKPWDYRFELNREGADSVLVDASTWTFVLLRHADGANEILLRASNLPQLSADERWQAAALVLEDMLGEDLVMDVVGEFDLLDQLEPHFAGSERPIQSLREAVKGPYQSPTG